jgi:peptidyl-prolyl cis-trans isomerase C
VKSQFGFHVIRVDDVRQAKAPDMAELKPQLIQMMSQDQNWQRTKFDEMLKRLKDKAKIQ